MTTFFLKLLQMPAYARSPRISFHWLKFNLPACFGVKEHKVFALKKKNIMMNSSEVYYYFIYPFFFLIAYLTLTGTYI